MIGWWAVPTILEGGTPEQIDKFVPATLRGEIIWCQLFSEPGAGSDLAALRTKAVRAEGGWKLTGQKVWTSAAQKAHWGVCLARTDPEAPKHKGITYFLIDMRSPGIVVRPLREITGDELFNEVFFDDVFVPDDMVVGTVNDGWRLARTTLANERVAMAQGTALGNPVEEMLRSVAERELDTALQDQTAKLILSAQAGSLLDQRIAQLAVGGQDTSAEASARKLIGGSAPPGACRVPAGAVRVGRPDRRRVRARLPQHPLPDDRRRHRADPAHHGRRAAARPAALGEPRLRAGARRGDVHPPL